MRKLPVLLVLTALLGIGTRTEAQFSYSVGNVNQFYQPLVGGYQTGFTATVLFKNINSYNDPQIITFNSFVLTMSKRVNDFCDLYGLSTLDCIVDGGSLGIQGNVQTGFIPIGNSFYYYAPSLISDSCTGNCQSRRFDIPGIGVGVLGCQGPAPTPDPYAGRTCDADGYAGALSMIARFAYTAPDSVPVFTFDASDLAAFGINHVVQGPNVFVPVTTTPEPSSWLLTATGLGLVGGVVRRRKRAIAGESTAA